MLVHLCACIHVIYIIILSKYIQRTFDVKPFIDKNSLYAVQEIFWNGMLTAIGQVCDAAFLD